MKHQYLQTFCARIQGECIRLMKAVYKESPVFPHTAWRRDIGTHHIVSVCRNSSMPSMIVSLSRCVGLSMTVLQRDV